jgi:hypothetical protein
MFCWSARWLFLIAFTDLTVIYRGVAVNFTGSGCQAPRTGTCSLSTGETQHAPGIVGFGPPLNEGGAREMVDGHA